MSEDDSPEISSPETGSSAGRQQQPQPPHTLYPPGMPFAGVSYPGGGANPTWGRDTGPAPPDMRIASAPLPGFGYSCPTPFPYYYTSTAPPFQGSFPAWSIPNPAHPYNHNVIGSYTHAPGGLNMNGHPGSRLPNGQPNIDSFFAANNMSNSTGGVGCEPGYDYFFPAEHTKIHVLKSGSTPPWRLPPNFTVPFHACHVPTKTTIEELMIGFGAVNPSPENNKITECCQGGGGKWYRGMQFSGDMADEIKKPISEFGWDSSRTGMAGEKSVVYLYVSRG